MRKIHALLAGVAAAAVVTGAHALPFQNGSFEDPQVATPAAGEFLGGSTGITGWTVVASPWDAVHLVNQGVSYHSMLSLNASHGSQWLDLGGPEWGGFNRGVSQTFDGVAGQSYSLSFDIGKLIGAGNAYVAVAVNGGAPQVFSNTTSSGTEWTKSWASYSLAFLGQASNTVTFLGVDGPGTAPPPNKLYDSPSWSIGLDNVSVAAIPSGAVAPIPEPSSVALMALGLGVVGFAARKRQQSR